MHATIGYRTQPALANYPMWCIVSCKAVLVVAQSKSEDYYGYTL